ncbi:beta-1,4-galactosyltransferase 1-like isoform X2 [Sardina pilchardus]|uniref:beta-1,4-galactosyltransferase 1-like isoform X2 n=1 Tax=Sardina pilchardus TaxID=27697 RepID=UPI002E128576
MTGVTFSFGCFGRLCALVTVLGVAQLLIALVYILYTEETLSLVPFFYTPLLNITRLPSNGSVDDMPSETLTQAPSVARETCPETPPHLVGPLTINFTHSLSLEAVQKFNPEVMEGGRWWPKDCVARQKVAIIIPFRHREFHLRYWLHYLHPILQRQQQEYAIYVINQYGETTFNRGMLMNVGYAEARKQYDYDCFVFSDVDIVPMDDRNFYKCYSQPRHISVAVDKFGFRLPYAQIFGGVTALSLEQFTKINGYPNNYWGWGGEDDDVSKRLSMRGMSISRPDSQTGRCRMIKHQREAHNAPNPKRVVSVEKNPLYTNVTVDIGKP